MGRTSNTVFHIRQITKYRERYFSLSSWFPDWLELHNSTIAEPVFQSEEPWVLTVCSWLQFKQITLKVQIYAMARGIYKTSAVTLITSYNS